MPTDGYTRLYIWRRDPKSIDISDLVTKWLIPKWLGQASGGSYFYKSQLTMLVSEDKHLLMLVNML